MPAVAQEPVHPPEFEVASVKRVLPADQKRPAFLPAFALESMGFQGGPGTKDPGRVKYEEVSLKMLLARAYHVKSEQVSGPDWLDSERYTVVANVPSGADADQVRVMLQRLLAERFQIVLHRETKEVSVYRLRVAKNGPKLKPAEELDKPADADARNARMRADVAKMMARSAENARQGIKGLPSRWFTLPNATLEKFADMLSSHVDRPVKDMTGLDGHYSFELHWNPERGVSTDADEAQLGTSIFTALQEQLGLRLEAGKEEIAMLLVDKAEKEPASN
jgi:uncharacterized protein (TIGR03435 family)